MLTNNLNDSEYLKLLRRVEKLEANGFLNSASISYGRLRFIGGKLLGEAGAVLEWIGSVITKGPWTNEGKFTNTGELEQNGDSTFNGNVSITEQLDVTAATRLRGVTTVENDLNVIGGGKITAGNVQISPAAAGGGAIIPLSGPLYVGGPGGVRLAEDVEVVASLDVGANVVVGEGLLNPGMGSSTNAAYKQVVVNTANGRLYYRP